MSKTPRTSARWREEWETHRRDIRSSPAQGMCDLCEDLETELAAAVEREQAARAAAFAECAEIVKDHIKKDLVEFIVEAIERTP